MSALHILIGGQGVEAVVWSSYGAQHWGGSVVSGYRGNAHMSEMGEGQSRDVFFWLSAGAAMKEKFQKVLKVSCEG